MTTILNLIQILIIIYFIIQIVKHRKQINLFEQKLLSHIGKTNSQNVRNIEAINETRIAVNDLTVKISKQKEIQTYLNEELANFLFQIVVDLEKLENRVERQGKTIQSVHNKNVTLGAKIKIIEHFIVAEELVEENQFDFNFENDLKEIKKQTKKTKKQKNEKGTNL